MGRLYRWPYGNARYGASVTCLLSGLHATRVACRDSISRQGLIPASPKGGRPFGVYIFREDDSFAHLGYNSRLVWAYGRGQDVYEIGYFGRAKLDQFVLNGLICFDSPQLVSLVTRNHE